ncbi:MAG: hypothetical protein ACYTFT_02680 [Planctomycetota bacterium]
MYLAGTTCSGVAGGGWWRGPIVADINKPRCVERKRKGVVGVELRMLLETGALATVTLWRMRAQPNDTDEAADRFMISVYREMTPVQKLRRVFGLNAMLRELTASTLKAKYGAGMSESELKLRLAARRLDRATMIGAFAWDPQAHGY